MDANNQHRPPSREQPQAHEAKADARREVAPEATDGGPQAIEVPAAAIGSIVTTREDIGNIVPNILRDAAKDTRRLVSKAIDQVKAGFPSDLAGMFDQAKARFMALPAAALPVLVLAGCGGGDDVGSGIGGADRVTDYESIGSHTLGMAGFVAEEAAIFGTTAFIGALNGFTNARGAWSVYDGGKQMAVFSLGQLGVRIGTYAYTGYYPGWEETIALALAAYIGLTAWRRVNG